MAPPTFTSDLHHRLRPENAGHALSWMASEREMCASPFETSKRRDRHNHPV